MLSSAFISGRAKRITFAPAPGSSHARPIIQATAKAVEAVPLTLMAEENGFQDNAALRDWAAAQAAR